MTDKQTSAETHARQAEITDGADPAAERKTTQQWGWLNRRFRPTDMPFWLLLVLVAIGLAPEATAVGRREAGFELRMIAMWPPNDSDAAQHIAWVNSGWKRLSAYGDGSQYPTFLTDEGFDGVRSAYRDGWPRLVALKDRYDPTNVFRLGGQLAG